MKTNKARRANKAVAKSRTARRKSKYVLRLFVAGATARSRQAVLRVRQLCEVELKGGCNLKVIDIYQQPKLARENQIVATPTLIIEFPPPLRRLIGSLANISGLLVELDLIKKGKITL
ncbi:MAG: circadian clock KaiB family protein [Verrucomicrobiales bacterium]|nr:circadian clock KaiB family protein [Verrucomicrobiales bacterium]